MFARLPQTAEERHQQPNIARCDTSLPNYPRQDHLMSNLTRTDPCEIKAALGGKMPVFLRDVNVERNAGRVRLSGAVRSYYYKQLAQEAVRQVDGVEQVENELIVQA